MKNCYNFLSRRRRRQPCVMFLGRGPRPLPPSLDYPSALQLLLHPLQPGLLAPRLHLLAPGLHLLAPGLHLLAPGLHLLALTM